MPLVVPGTDVRLPSYGYGCAALMARTSRAESVRLLEEAFDAGVTHFDVARSYGYGEAESQAGDVRAFGVATSQAAAQAIVAQRPEFAPLVQVPDALVEPLPAGLGPAVVTHSVLAAGE